LFTDPGIWHSANNHILNTILYQLSIGVLGLSDLAMRLPNVLAFLGLSLIGYCFLFNDLTKTGARWILLVFLFLNPYVLDFFSLCRGYGLSMFFHFSALVFLYRFLHYQKAVNIYMAFALLLLAALALLTNLILFPVYSFALWLYLLRQKRLTSHAIIAPLIFGIASLFLLLRPIQYLSQFGEFEYGVNNIYCSISSFVSQSLGFNNYFGPQTVYYVTIALLSAFIIILLLSIRMSKASFFGLSLILLFISLYGAYLILDIQFPSERKTTIYVPLIAMLLGIFWQEKKTYSLDWLIPMFLTTIFSINMINAYRLNSVIEWHYDRYTKQQIYLLAEMNQQRVSLKTHWLLHPTSSYYINSRGLHQIELLPYEKEFNVKEKPDYLLGFNGELVAYADYALLNAKEDISIYKKK